MLAFSILYGLLGVGIIVADSGLVAGAAYIYEALDDTWQTVVKIAFMLGFVFMLAGLSGCAH